MKERKKVERSISYKQLIFDKLLKGYCLLLDKKHPALLVVYNYKLYKPQAIVQSCIPPKSEAASLTQAALLENALV